MLNKRIEKLEQAVTPNKCTIDRKIYEKIMTEHPEPEWTHGRQAAVEKLEAELRAKNPNMPFEFGILARIMVE